LVDFWTYTCINCIRTLPYIRAWNEKYADKGLVIIGVHSPEFEFEKKPENLAKAITDYKLQYPIMQDNDFATWRAYENRYWPAKYLVDAQGKIRYTHFGEGNYDETESQIQKLLKESDQSLQFETALNQDYKIETKTPELYLGYGRLEAINVKESIATDKIVQYTPELKSPLKNTFDFNGKVLISEEYANPTANTSLRLRYDSREVFLVMKAKTGVSQVRILLDGKAVPIEYAGEDLKDGQVVISSDRLYKLIKSPRQEEHTLTIEFLDDQTELFAFTFG
jgi:thiol-disulfide isomerase/thioredoxin